MEQNTTMTKRSSHRDMVGGALQHIEEDAAHSRVLYDLGLNTELAQVVENFFAQPTEFLDRMRVVHDELLSQLFMVGFLHLINQAGLDKLVNTYAVRVNGTDITLWIILKDNEDTFENRSAFYGIISELSNVPQFEKINVDFLIMREADLPIPESFKHTKA